MALGDPYATLAEIKSRLGLTDTNDDLKLTNILAAASRGIEKFTGRQFNDAGSATARLYEPADLLCCLVDDFSTTTGLVIATDENDDGVFEVTWTTADYELSPLNGVVDGETGWPYWRIRGLGTKWFPVQRYPVYRYRSASVQVTARWGWTAVPAPVKEACLLATEEAFKLKDAPFTPAVRLPRTASLSR
jgi:hypothetical protein